MNLKQFFEEKGYSIKEKEDFSTYIEKWNSWYVAKVKGFHNYWIYNRPGHKVKRQKRSMQMAKKVCEDWADLLYNERVKIAFKNDKDTELLNKIFDMINFTVIVNRGIEKSFALGTGALVLSIQNLKTDGTNYIVDENTKPKIEFVEAQKIYPLSWDHDEITECAFVTYRTEKGKNYVYISMHIKDENGKYIIKNFKFKVNNKQLEETEDDTILKEFDTQGTTPWFSIIKPNICNNIDFETPFGISIFANSIFTLMNLDNIYDSKDLEITLGRRRTFISEDMMSFTTDGNELMPAFDPNDISVYALPKGFNKDMLIQSDNDDLRTDKMIAALNSELNILSSKVGFGNERYKFERSEIKTATEVISVNSDMYRTIKKHELVLENALLNFIRAIVEGCKNYTKYEFSNDIEEIKIDFDDSIIEDKATEQLRAQTEVGQGLRSKIDYLQNIRGFGKEKAEEELESIRNEKITNQQAFGFEVSEE